MTASTRNRVRILLSALSLLFGLVALFMIDDGALEPCRRLERERDAQQAYLKRIDPSFVTLRHKLQTSVSILTAQLDAAEAMGDVAVFKGLFFGIAGMVLSVVFFPKGLREALTREGSTS